jgi:hypothetical protein
VTQFCIEEACFERLEHAERRRGSFDEEAFEGIEEPEPSLHQLQAARHAQLMREVQ